MQDRVRQILNIIFGFGQIVTNVWNSQLFGLEDSAVVSDSFYTYLIPTGYTFAVWGPIYLGLAVYSIYQALPGQADRALHRRIGWVTAFVALGNALWTPIFTLNGVDTTVSNILPTALIIGLMLAGLAFVFVTLRNRDAQLTRADRWCVQIPLSGYYAWVTIATTVNIVVLLMTLGYDPALFSIPGSIWSPILQVVAVGIIGTMILYSAGNHGMFAYTLVAVWAFVGIYAGNMPRSGLAGGTALICAMLIFVTAVLRFRHGSPTQDTPPPTPVLGER